MTLKTPKTFVFISKILHSAQQFFSSARQKIWKESVFSVVMNRIFVSERRFFFISSEPTRWRSLTTWTIKHSPLGRDAACQLMHDNPRPPTASCADLGLTSLRHFPLLRGHRQVGPPGPAPSAEKRKSREKSPERQWNRVDTHGRT